MALSLEQMAVTPTTPGADRISVIPLVIHDNLSNTSMAGECFVNQRFSRKLQSFLVGYVSALNSNRGIFESL